MWVSAKPNRQITYTQIVVCLQEFHFSSLTRLIEICCCIIANGIADCILVIGLLDTWSLVTDVLLDDVPFIIDLYIVFFRNGGVGMMEDKVANHELQSGDERDDDKDSRSQRWCRHLHRQ